jgi:hypothetical protein
MSTAKNQSYPAGLQQRGKPAHNYETREAVSASSQIELETLVGALDLSPERI